ncbi:MAG: hypothetical protein EOO90_03605 [Pedobacter sp.]|nr:MAG: hypothetical protein EOO90_03605 [Pedobacter sp.]
MKTIKFLLGAALCFYLASCTGDEVKDFMPGSYVNRAGAEFSVASDTLTIELVEGNNYRVDRRTGFNLIRDGNLGAREFATEEWTCAYDPGTQILTELRKGKMLTFYPKDRSLKVGSRVYQKIN